MMLRWMFGRRWLATTVLVIVAAAVCARLGIWQLDRLATRRAFNAHVEAMRSLEALTLPGGADLPTQEYREAQARGIYDFGQQVAIRNQAHDGQYGYKLMTPMRLQSAEGDPGGVEDAVVLIDRGWIPAEGNGRPADWHQYDAEGTVEVRGVIRLGQSAPTFGGQAQPTPTPGEARSDYWMYVDLQAIAKQMPYEMLPVYVQLDNPLNAGSPPIAAAPVPELTEGPHQGYALQWFAFGAILIAGYPFFIQKKEARPA